MKLLLNIIFILFACVYLSGCTTLGYPKFGLYSASPAPIENVEGQGWRANDDIPWANMPPPNPRFLDNAGSGPIWH